VKSQEERSNAKPDEDTSPRRPGAASHPRGGVRAALLQAAVNLARSGGPDAVVLREVTREVGVVPNAAYRHFADRDALLSAVRDEAVRELAERMLRAMNAVRQGRHTPAGAARRMRAVGETYLEFARTEPGLFDTAFKATEHPSGTPDAPVPFDHLRTALDDLVMAGLLDPGRRPDVEYPTWAAVHGLAMLLRGPLLSLPDSEKARLESQTLAFIGAAVTRA
jgi:AcrR family transcriptional regulator